MPSISDLSWKLKSSVMMRTKLGAWLQPNGAHVGFLELYLLSQVEGSES